MTKIEQCHDSLESVNEKEEEEEEEEEEKGKSCLKEG